MSRELSSTYFSNITYDFLNLYFIVFYIKFVCNWSDIICCFRVRFFNPQARFANKQTGNESIGVDNTKVQSRRQKFLPSLNIYGIDNSAVRIFFAALKSKILKRNVDFKKQDIFQTDLSNADVVYTYLWYDLMPILEKKLQKELKQSAVVVTNTSHFKDWQPVEKIVTCPKISKTPDFETLFVYVKR